MKSPVYAGIGSRETPADVLSLMTMAAKELADYGWKLRSGGAKGADHAFAYGTANKEIHVPWDGYNHLKVDCLTVLTPTITAEVRRIAEAHHPAWDVLSPAVRNLMCRNVTIVLGRYLDDHAKFVTCWTPGGKLVGGTAHGMRVAYSYDIPVFNMAISDDIDRMVEFVKGYQHG